MKKKWMKRIICLMFVILLTGCGTGAESGGGSYDAEGKNIKQAGLGAMAFLYDDTVWTDDKEQETDTSLVFRNKEESVLGVSCSRESYYQHPLDMINTSKQIYATFAGYEEIEEPKEVQVQNDSWYEWEYRYEENGTPTVALQRFYAKNYYAYTISYVAEEKNYEAGKNEALKIMNSAVMSVPDNAEAEEKAKEFLVGEWDLGDSGYLIMNQDGTYEWYMDSSRDAQNMHRGTYGCDVENTAAGFSEGQGVYFVLFPEVLYVQGEAGQTANAKYDYVVSLDEQADGSYQMINGNTFAIYDMKKQ